MQHFNWTLIQKTCPEFSLNFWDILFAIVAVIGVVVNIILMCKLKKNAKTAVFLPNLAGIDYFLCLMYLWQYFYTTMAYYFECDVMAGIRVDYNWTFESLRDYFEIILILLMFCIVFEKFLWTCSSRTRHTWRCFIIGKYKFWTVIGMSVFAVSSALMHNWNLLQLSDVPFCDVVLLPVPIKHPFFRFIQLYFIPYVSDIFIGLVFIFIVITLIRLSKVSTGNKPVEQDEEVNLETQVGEDYKEATHRIKRTIIVSLIFCSIFLVRAIFWFAFIKPNSTKMSTRNRHYKIMKLWVFDCVTMIIAATRILIYYVVCKLDIVAEYPANGVIQ